MNKTTIAILTLTAGIVAASCQKESEPETKSFEPMTINAVSEGVGTATRTEMAYKYDILWSEDDQICVTDGTADDTFTLTDGAGTTMGTFTQDGTASFLSEVKAYYPATMVQDGGLVWPASQTNDQTIPMYCSKTVTGSIEEFNFKSLGSVLQIVFNSRQENVTLQSIEIKDGSKAMSGAFTVDTDGKAVITASDKAGITLDLGTGVVLGKAANYFNIAIPAGNYQDLTLVFTATDGKKCTMTKGKVNISHNTVGRLTLAGEKFKSDPPTGGLSGEFSVSDTKKVLFSKGNLTYNVSTATWAFYEHQYDCATDYDANLISHFTWGYNAEKSIEPDGKDSNNVSRTSGNLSQDEDWGSRIGDGNTWRTLTASEWQYLFYNHSSKWVSVNGVNGYVIAPDGFGGQLADSYADDAALATDKLVFLPAAGERFIYFFDYVGSRGNYWSSSADDGERAYIVRLDEFNASPDYLGQRLNGYSVRLITECQ